MTDFSTATCKLEGCTVAQDGKCLENLALESCPNFGAPRVKSDPDSTAGVPIRSGSSLTPEEAGHLLADDGCTVVIVAGTSNSGKTTLLTTIFESFIADRFAEFEFAGSDTVLGFDQRGYLDHVAYGQESAGTVKTPFASPSPFLHLRVRRLDAGRRTGSLLLSDVSGEIFRTAANHSDALRKIPGVRRGDHFTLLLDGELLANDVTRQSVVSQSRLILAACVVEGAISPDTAVELVVTKLDVWNGNGIAEAFIREKVAAEAERIKPSCKSVRVFEIAARPKSGPLHFANGVDGLLQAWLERRPLPSRTDADSGSMKSMLRELAFGRRRS